MKPTCRAARFPLFLLVVLLASPSGLLAQTLRSFEPGPRPVGEIRRHAREVVRSHRAAQSSQAFVATVLDLCWLHTEIALHPEFPANETLANTRAQLEAVLKGAVGDLQVTIRQRDRDGETTRFQTSPYTDPADRSRSDRSTEWARWEMVQSRWMNQISGGPLATLGQLPGNFAPPFSDQELIQLITTTVEPDSWRVNGGSGEVQYYDPALALIVFNSMKVQDEIHDLLLRLR